MKLSAQYTKASIIVTIIVLLFGGMVYFFAINKLGRNQLDKDLTEEITEVVDYINQNGKLPKQVDFDEDQTVFIKTNQADLPTRFFDTVYNDAKERENEAGRAVSALVKLNGQNYQVIITESRESTENLIQIIAIITVVLMVVLLFILFITNRFVFAGLWKPFYDTLSAMREFNLSDGSLTKLKTSKIDEFSELNQVVQSMSYRIKDDYQSLKDFTDNASHEMLTPLAVITAKLDTVIQNPALPVELFEQIDDIYVATNKLSRLNQTLLLLTKIENNLIEDKESIDLDVFIAEKLKQFQELILAKNITVVSSLYTKYVDASKFLLDILFNNLMSNAIRHNNEYGELIITLDKTNLIFQNRGSEIPLNLETVFERFKKGSKSDGTGLGLSLVENICRMYGWKIEYHFTASLHSFKITF